ncbi:hypothetical protein J7W08_01915 [Methanococcoides orientis]|uniref:hypothetical protein n=1 Tax=Methanococcoides orientis TaxID=2822137 RepID=UPI001E56654B|nr:hypothetical protein [Methanococcoides orientis]UGV41090.1 hypothetical protein J7W08_01915 [Methanococcoides orientis]
MNVVIAHLHNQVQSKLNSETSENRDSYYKKLNNLADSLGQTEYKQELNGLDRIISYQSGIQLEHHFQEFVEECAKLFDVKAIVILFDDVDMALNKTHELLETIRRLLSCPKILPIVCGNHELFYSILQDHFQYGGNQNWEIRRPILNPQNKELTKEYLLKVFPSHLRISLFPLNLLMDTIYIRTNNENGYPVTSYLNDIKKAVCPLVNGEETSFYYPEPRTPRELIQTIKVLKSSVSIPENENKDSSIETKLLWDNYATLCEARGVSIGQLVAESEQLLRNIRKNQDEKLLVHPLRKLRLFDVLKQSESNDIIREYDYYTKLNKALLKINTNLSNWASKQQIFIEYFNDKQRFLIKSMPPVEFFIYGLFISKRALETTLETLRMEELSREDGTNPLNNAKIMLSLFTHYNYYSSSNQKTAQLFFGKPFELLSEGLLLGRKTDDLNLISKRNQYWIRTIEDLLYTRPFHSIYSINPTKSIEYENEENESEYENIYTKYRCDKNSNVGNEKKPIEQFAEEITRWENNWATTLDQAQKLGLSHLLSLVMNKVFSQLHEMRVSGVFKNDTLPYATKRFEYVLVNAFASFLKPDKVVKQNVAITINFESLMDSRYQYLDASIKQNIIEYIGEKDSSDKETNDKNKNETLNRRLLRAIWNHPIFELFDAENDNPTILKFGSISILDKYDNEVKELVNTLSMYSINEIKTLSENKVKNLVNRFKKLESKIYSNTGIEFKFKDYFGPRNKKYPELMKRNEELGIDDWVMDDKIVDEVMKIL